jgi:hygromycin-B 4-O-kinase
MDATGNDVHDLARTENFLRDRFGADIHAVTPLVGGAWSRAYAYRHGDLDLVVRFSALDEDFRKDELAARHASPSLPIPRMIEIGDTPSGFYAISERLFGDVLEDVDGTQMRALLPSILGALDAMRFADVGASSGYGSWGADGQAPYPSWRAMLLDTPSDLATQRHHGWRARLASSAIGDRPFFEAFERLAELAEIVPEDRHLIHSDLLYRNVLVDDARITGILDWGSAMYGDPVYDLAWITFWSAWYPAWRDVDFLGAAARHYASIGLEVPGFDARHQACELYIGLTGQAYQAFRGFWSELEWTAARTLEVARR